MIWEALEEPTKPFPVHIKNRPETIIMVQWFTMIYIYLEPFRVEEPTITKNKIPRNALTYVFLGMGSQQGPSWDHLSGANNCASLQVQDNPNNMFQKQEQFGCIHNCSYSVSFQAMIMIGALHLFHSLTLLLPAGRTRASGQWNARGEGI